MERKGSAGADPGFWKGGVLKFGCVYVGGGGGQTNKYTNKC